MNCIIVPTAKYWLTELCYRRVYKISTCLLFIVPFYYTRSLPFDKPNYRRKSEKYFCVAPLFYIQKKWTLQRRGHDTPKISHHLTTRPQIKTWRYFRFPCHLRIQISLCGLLAYRNSLAIIGEHEFGMLTPIRSVFLFVRTITCERNIVLLRFGLERSIN